MIKIDVPTFEHELISTGDKITCRAFTVKEEKLFLIAAAADDFKDFINTTLQVIQNCIVKPEIDVTDLPYFEIDYLLIRLRAMSIGDSVEFDFTCSTELDPAKACGTRFTDVIRMSDVVIHKENSISNVIKFGNVGIEMRYPSYFAMRENAMVSDDIQQNVNLICESIEKIWEGETVYSRSDMSLMDIQNTVEGLTKENFDKLREFVLGAPWLRIEKEVTCPKCGTKEVIKYEDFESFFE